MMSMDMNVTRQDLGDNPLYASENLGNSVISFHIPSLNIRGRFIRLGAVLTDVINKHGYPVPVSRLLGEATLLGALLGTSLKFSGRFTIQLQGNGPVSLLISDFQTPGGIRACATVKDKAQVSMTENTALVGDGQLVFTIDQGAHMNRYQGVVPLDGDDLASAAEGYFMQSEQLPTVIKLAALEQTTSGDLSGWVGGGLILQHLPPFGEAIHRDLPSGADEMDDVAEDDNWITAKTLAATIKPDELTDPTVNPVTVLYRLFNEFDVELSNPLEIERFCQCSEEKCLSLLGQFEHDELKDMLKDEKIDMTCEFCSTEYVFGLDDNGPVVLQS